MRVERGVRTAWETRRTDAARRWISPGPAVPTPQRDPLNAERQVTHPESATRGGTQATLEGMAFLMHAAGRPALAILGPADRDPPAARPGHGARGGPAG